MLIPAIATPLLREILALAGFYRINETPFVFNKENTMPLIVVGQGKATAIPRQTGIAINELRHGHLEEPGDNIGFVLQETNFAFPLTARATA